MQKDHPIIIIGGGGHTRVLIGILKRAALPIHGILTRDAGLLGTEIHGVPVLGLEGEFDLADAPYAIVNGVGNRASKHGSGLDIRAGIYAHYHAQGYFVAPVISADAVIQPDVTMGAAVQVMPGAIIQPGAMIGENAIINSRAVIEHDAVVAPHAHIAPGAVLCGGASIGEAAHVGAGAIVLQGVKIGDRAVIAAGVTVRRDVADDAVYFG